MKLDAEALEEIYNDDLDIDALTAKYKVSRSTIYRIKEGKYHNRHMLKTFTTEKNRFEEIIKEEYIKIYHKEPDKIVVMNMVEIVQALVKPENIIIQIAKINIESEDNFRLLVNRNIKFQLKS